MLCGTDLGRESFDLFVQELHLKLHFLGANRQVTGSCYVLETKSHRIMIDCGLFQERRFLSRNWNVCPIPPSSIDFLLLSHAHLDHTGLIPKLVKDGFRGCILATAPTIDIAEIIMRDSAKIQFEDAKYKAKRHKKEKREPKFPPKPLYLMEDVDETIRLFGQPVPYEKPVRLTDEITATWREAGHILGSATLQLTVKAELGTREIIFSGDLGQWGKPIIRDPVLLECGDYVVMESTYGDKDHPEFRNVADQLEKVIGETVERGGKVVIPTFAVERAQELMWHIGRLVHSDRIADIPVYLDSPMAVDVTKVFRNHRTFYDAVTTEAVGNGDMPFRFEGLKLARSVEESKAINKVKGPAVIMSSSGMCTGGRIKHHLRNTITNSANTILFVGYQAEGSLGRVIVRGDKEVRIHGRRWMVNAEIRQISGFSAHGDRDDLMRWLDGLGDSPRHVFLTHGEESVSHKMADFIRNQRGIDTSVPEYQHVFDIV